MDRRHSLQWMLAAGVATGTPALAKPSQPAPARPTGTGTDPDLTRSYKSGELWPLSFTERERRCAAALCALIIPADEHSPSAAELQVQVFIDEWISAPYPSQQKDRATILQGLAWLDGESQRRFGRAFADARPDEQAQLADALAVQPPADPALAAPASFFARFRDLTAGGFYTTPTGMKDLGFVGNTPSREFAGPSEAVIKLVGIS